MTTNKTEVVAYMSPAYGEVVSQQEYAGWVHGVLTDNDTLNEAYYKSKISEYSEPLICLSDYEKLAQYYKNGIDCFANPCEIHSGERTPSFPEFFEKYGGQCLICVVDNNKALQDECNTLREKTSVGLGVGYGGGNLFVHGDYDSIKRVQALIFEREVLVKALELIADTDPDEGTAWFHDIAHKALAAYRKQGGEL